MWNIILVRWTATGAPLSLNPTNLCRVTDRSPSRGNIQQGSSHLIVTFHTGGGEDRKTAAREGMLKSHWGLCRK